MQIHFYTIKNTVFACTQPKNESLYNCFLYVLVDFIVLFDCFDGYRFCSKKYVSQDEKC